MAKEAEDFRDNLELLNQRFPDADMLTPRQTAEFVGCSLATVYRRIRFNPATRRISKASLARQICT